jgi:asparagine synthase (glutamine-hydrolysing)
MRMLTAMRHRGPDDQGITRVPDPAGRAPPAVLVHTRLAILDLSAAGHQPMADHSDATRRANWIVYNGEVFNFAELHEPLAHAGWPCRTRSDTEVLLNSYRVWGEAAVDRFRGMFAWCLLDGDRGTAWFARDRLGIKPLYLFRCPGGGLLFASEVRTLLAAGPELVPPRVSARAVESFLAQGAVSGHECFVHGVHLLGPGESLVTDWAGEQRFRRRYWKLDFAESSDVSGNRSEEPTREHAIHELGRQLREAVSLRLISDVPLGLFLSSGIDSAALAALATELSAVTVETISIGFDEPEFDETGPAAAVARALGTRHRTLRLSGNDILADLGDALAAVDQPTVDGFNTYFVARAARHAGLTVALSGVGGDELFGGYASFVDVPKALRMRRRLGWARRWTHALAGAARATGGRRGVKVCALFERQESPQQIYLLRRELFLPAERRLLHRLPERCDSACGLPREELDALGGSVPWADLTNQVSFLELSVYLRNMLLRDCDVFSMAHGLEVRVPFLDHQIVGMVSRLPGRWKRPDPRPKPLLVDAVGPGLPSAVFARPKRGFTFPWDAWLRSSLKARVHETLTDRGVWHQLGFDSTAPEVLWNRFLRLDPAVAAPQIIALLVLADCAARQRLEATA